MRKEREEEVVREKKENKNSRQSDILLLSHALFLGWPLWWDESNSGKNCLFFGDGRLYHQTTVVRFTWWYVYSTRQPFFFFFFFDFLININSWIESWISFHPGLVNFFQFNMQFSNSSYEFNLAFHLKQGEQRLK